MTATPSVFAAILDEKKVCWLLVARLGPRIRLQAQHRAGRGSCASVRGFLERLESDLPWLRRSDSAACLACVLWDRPRAAAGRLLARILELGAGYPETGLSASIGVAVLQPVPASADLALKAADQAMYAAKSGGKSRVVVLEPGASD